MLHAITETHVARQPKRPRTLDIDHCVSLRIRQRRIMLGLTQQQMAELIGVTYQQAHKYETGINRISAGRLYHIAKALDVEIAYFFNGIGDNEAPRSETLPGQRMLLDLSRNFSGISDKRHREAVCQLARALVAEDSDG